MKFWREYSIRSSFIYIFSQKVQSQFKVKSCKNTRYVLEFLLGFKNRTNLQNNHFFSHLTQKGIFKVYVKKLKKKHY